MPGQDIMEITNQIWILILTTLVASLNLDSSHLHTLKTKYMEGE
jgi:hypothetical protein